MRNGLKAKEASRGSPAPPFATDAFNPRQPRDRRGRWASFDEGITALLGLAGQNTAVHMEFGQVRRPAELSKLLGVDVRGFKHGVSNQALAHSLSKHGDANTENARGQKPITKADFARLPDILKAGSYGPAEDRAFGPRRVKITAKIGDDTYTYIAEARRRKQRLDMVSLWKS